MSRQGETAHAFAILTLVVAVAGGCTRPAISVPAYRVVAVGGIIVQGPVVLYVQRIHGDTGHYVGYVDRVLDSLEAQAEAGNVSLVFWPEDETTPIGIYGASEFSRSVELAKAEVRGGRAEPDAKSFNRGMVHCVKLAKADNAHIVLMGRDSLFRWLSPSEATSRKDAIRAAAKTCKIDAILVGAPVPELADLVNGTRVSVEW